MLELVFGRGPSMYCNQDLGLSEPPSPLWLLTFSTERNQSLPFSVLSSSGQSLLNSRGQTLPKPSSGQSLLKSSNGQLGLMAEKPHMCNLCATGQLCGRMQTMSSQKRFPCHLCDIFFPLEKGLDTHLLEVHRTLPLRSNPANIPQNIQPNTISILAKLNPIANTQIAPIQTQFNSNSMAASILQTIQPDPISILAKLNPIANAPNAPIQTQFNQTNMASRAATMTMWSVTPFFPPFLLVWQIPEYNFQRLAHIVFDPMTFR